MDGGASPRRTALTWQWGDLRPPSRAQASCSIDFSEAARLEGVVHILVGPRSSPTKPLTPGFVHQGGAAARVLRHGLRGGPVRGEAGGQTSSRRAGLVAEDALRAHRHGLRTARADTRTSLYGCQRGRTRPSRSCLGNLLATTVRRTGEADAALAGADVVSRDVFEMTASSPCRMEGRGVIASFMPAQVSWNSSSRHRRRISPACSSRHP